MTDDDRKKGDLAGFLRATANVEASAVQPAAERDLARYAREAASNDRGGRVMVRWRRHAFAPNLFVLLATMLMLAGAADAQSAPPAAKVGGAWETTWGGGQAVLDLTQKGSAVTGTYSGTNVGKVKGTIAGNVLTGYWLGAANDSGGFVLKFSADGKSFAGTWGLGASKTDGGPWEGMRK